MRTIIRETAVETVEQADQIEQRSDVRVRLAVVVTEEAFVITDQAGINVGSDELVVVRKALRGREFQRAVVTTSGTKALRRGRTIESQASRIFRGLTIA